MSDLVIVSDAHIHNHARFGGAWVEGVNRRAQLGLDTLRRVVTDLRSGDHLLAAGDTFHTKNPDPAVARAVAEVFRGDLLLGNHEQLQWHGPGDHALQYVASTKGINVVFKGQVREYRLSQNTSLKVGLIPFSRDPAVQVVGDFMDLLRRRGEKVNAIVGHYGILAPGAPQWANEATDYVSLDILVELAQRVGATSVIMGHDHNHRLWHVDGVRVIQIGALCPTGFSDAGDVPYGSVIRIHPSGKVTRTRVPGPRFYKVTTMKKLAKMAPTLRLGDHLLLGMSVHKEIIHELRKAGVEWEFALLDSPSEEPVKVKASMNVEKTIRKYIRKTVPGDLVEPVVSRSMDVWNEARGRST